MKLRKLEPEMKEVRLPIPIVLIVPIAIGIGIGIGTIGIGRRINVRFVEQYLK